MSIVPRTIIHCAGAPAMWVSETPQEIRWRIENVRATEGAAEAPFAVPLVDATFVVFAGPGGDVTVEVPGAFHPLNVIYVHAFPPEAAADAK